VPFVGLALIIATGVLCGLVFAVAPSLDLELAARLREILANDHLGRADLFLKTLRQHNVNLTLATLAVCVGALALKLVRPRVGMLVPPRVVLLLVTTFALGPGLLVNGVLKEHWSRPRPGAVVELGGTMRFVPWWDTRGTCKHNCSFVSGEASSAFAMLAPAAVVPPPLQYPAIGAALLYGTMVSVGRVAVGGHFPSDVILAGVLTALLVWILHGSIFRWPATRLSEAEAERLFEITAYTLSRTLAVLLDQAAVGMARAARSLNEQGRSSGV
jgi:lipid A 4'-phosphatase